MRKVFGGLLRGIWCAFRDGAAMYAASYWAAPGFAMLRSDSAEKPELCPSACIALGVCRISSAVGFGS